MSLSLVTPPAAEPISTADALNHLRLPQDAVDAPLVTSLIVAAREYAEAITSRQLLTATWSTTFDGFPSRRMPLPLPLPPLQPTGVVVTYIDVSGAPQTWASNQYVVDAPQGPHAVEGRLYPIWGVDWPVTGWRQDPVKVQFAAGYGDAGSSVPTAIKQAMLLAIGAWYENREDVIVGVRITAVPLPLAVDALLAPFTRLTSVMR